MLIIDSYFIFFPPKAIRDGVMDANINRERGYMITTEAGDLYSTREPMDQFHQRIRFCLGIRNQAIKAMRYPPKQYSKDLESAEVGRRYRRYYYSYEY